MDKWLDKKTFEAEFAPFTDNGTQIWVIAKVKKLPLEIVKMAIRLANLDFINYVRVCPETLAASSENHSKRPKVPICEVGHETAIGIHILYSSDYKTIDFYDINSPKKGFGGKMVEAVFNDFPKDWQPAVLMDWSDGFWDRMKEKHRPDQWLA